MKNYAAYIANKLRASLWWNHLVPPIISVVYALSWIHAVPLQEIWLPLLLFVISIIGTAGFGYWLNDWADIEADRLAGKPNMVSDLSWQNRAIVLVTLLIAAWLPWLGMPFSQWSYIWLSLLQVCFVLYSVPPFRFKQRSFWGIFCDIQYGHVLPIAITLATFLPLWSLEKQWSWGFIAGLIGLLHLKGIRNIIEHQINDRKNDRRSRTYTFVQAIGPLPAADLLRKLIVPVELLIIAILLAFWSIPLLVSYGFYLLICTFLFWRWGIFRLPMRRWSFHFWYIANNFYEGWLPLSILLLAMLAHPVYGVILLIHLLLFPKSLQIIKWTSQEINFLLR